MLVAGPLLQAAAQLIRHFPLFRDIVVSVARKTDAQMWPALFAAVGSPGALLEALLDVGALQSAACCLLIVDRIQGAQEAHGLALRLIQVCLTTPVKLNQCCAETPAGRSCCLCLLKLREFVSPEAHKMCVSPRRELLRAVCTRGRLVLNELINKQTNGSLEKLARMSKCTPACYSSLYS